MTPSGQSVSAAELAIALHDRKASEKIRAAATLLAEAGVHLSRIVPHQSEARARGARWYDCNKLYHGAIAWLDEWGPGR